MAVVADMGLMGPDGLTDVTGKGAGGALGLTSRNSIQSMTEYLDTYDHISESDGSQGRRRAAD